MIKFIHSYWAYVVLIVVTLATFNAIFKYLTKKEFSPKDFRISLFALIVTHIQFLIGILLYLTNGYFSMVSEVGGMGEVMKNAALRNIIVEHPTTMVAAIALLTVGYSKHKRKLTSVPKFKMLAIFYTLAYILILVKLPWSNWLA
jgi:hypothetical protein